MTTRQFSGYELTHIEPNSHGKTVLDCALGKSSIYTCGSDCSVAVWDSAHFVCKRRMPKLAGWVVKCVLSPDEEFLLCCAGDKLYVYDCRSDAYRKVCDVSTESGMV